MTDDRTVAQRRADELDDLEREAERAVYELKMARQRVTECVEAASRAELRYERAALWIKADELRTQLADVEAEAAAIAMPKGDS
jgi:uncharacterized membrane protein